MITLSEAEKIIENELRRREKSIGRISLQMISSSTLEQDFGWVFFYNSKEFIESGNLSDMLAGNAPLIVDKFDGSVHVTGTAYPIEFYIKEFKKNRCMRNQD
jgi:Immunity protein 35